MPVIDGKNFYAADLQPVMVRRLAYNRLQRTAKVLKKDIMTVLEDMIDRYHIESVGIDSPSKVIARLKKLSTSDE